MAITFAVQEHNDRLLSEELTETAAELQDTGERIMSIRDADLKDMNDYVRAYKKITPLLEDDDRQLQKITDLYNQARAGQESFQYEQTLPKAARDQLGKRQRSWISHRH